MALTQSQPDIAALDLLVSVAHTGSIRQAAMRHHISQPAASVRIRELERVLGLRLVERATTGARLTSDGLAIVGWAEQVLSAMRMLTSGAQALRLDQDSQLRLAASLTVAEYLLPGWLAPLYASIPAAVSLRMANSEEVAELFVRDEVDLGFVEGSSLPSGLQGRTVYRDELVVVVSPQHPWARRRTPLSAAMLADSPLVSREVGSGTRQVLEAALAEYGRQPLIAVEFGSTTAIKAAVAAGLGPAVLSKLAVSAELIDRRLVAIECHELHLARSIRAVWRSRTTLSPLAKELLSGITSRG
ncbi:MAG TPA: LysR family transcriptional regulator [Acidimicrobiales bacterium]